VEFFDSDPAPPTESAQRPARQRGGRRPPRTQRQQIMARRGLALGAGLIVLILLVLGIKGCLNARKERALKNYAGDVTQIVDETQQTSKAFFGRLEDPGPLSVTEFQTEVAADRSAMDNYLARVDSLSAPGDMSRAQNALELVYELRDSAMTKIADKIPVALGEAGSDTAVTAIARQMRTLMASDILYAAVVRPEINAVLADNGIEGDDVPKSEFIPAGNGISWLQPDTIRTALGRVSGGGATSSQCPCGTGLVATALDGTPLQDGVPVTASPNGTPELDVQVQNQGAGDLSGVTVAVSVDGKPLAEKQIASIAPQETQTVTIPLTPTPSGSVTLDVEVKPVPGEQLTDNNKASYPITFQ
jgi:hypothetical protein